MLRFRTRSWLWAIGTGLAALLLIVVVATTPVLSPFSPPPVPTLSPDIRLLRVDNNANRRPVQALYHLEAYAASQGWSPELHQQAGDLWAETGDLSRAVFHWELAPRDNSLLLRSLAQAYVGREDWARVRDTVSELLALQPDDPWANYQMGLITAITDPTAAEPYLRQAALDPAYTETARAVRVTLLENRETDATADIGIPVLVGLTLIDQAIWPHAELAFQQANARYLAANGEPLAEALAYISLTQDENGKDGSAAIQQAVELRPSDPQIRFLQALHYRHTGTYQDSLNAMIQAVALSPESPVLYAELGTSYRLVGELEQAEYWLRAAVAFSGNDPDFQELLAQFYAEEAYNLGSDGLVALDSAIQNNPNDPDLLAGLGWAFYTVGDYAEGQAYLEQALEIAPLNDRARYYMARVLLGTGEEDDRAYNLLTDLATSDGPFAADAARILQNLDS